MILDVGKDTNNTIGGRMSEQHNIKYSLINSVIWYIVYWNMYVSASVLGSEEGVCGMGGVQQDQNPILIKFTFQCNYTQVKVNISR